MKDADNDILFTMIVNEMKDLQNVYWYEKLIWHLVYEDDAFESGTVRKTEVIYYESTI